VLKISLTIAANFGYSESVADWGGDEVCTTR